MFNRLALVVSFLIINMNVAQSFAGGNIFNEEILPDNKRATVVFTHPSRFYEYSNVDCDKDTIKVIRKLDKVEAEFYIAPIMECQDVLNYIVLSSGGSNDEAGTKIRVNLHFNMATRSLDKITLLE